ERFSGRQARGALGPELRSAAAPAAGGKAAAGAHLAADRWRHPRADGGGGPAGGWRHRGAARTSLPARRGAALAVAHDGRDPLCERARRRLAPVARTRRAARACRAGPGLNRYATVAVSAAPTATARNSGGSAMA